MEKRTIVFYDSLSLYGLTLAFPMKSYDRNRELKAGDVIHGLERRYGECICVAIAGRDADRPGYSH